MAFAVAPTAGRRADDGEIAAAIAPIEILVVGRRGRILAGILRTGSPTVIVRIRHQRRFALGRKIPPDGESADDRRGIGHDGTLDRAFRLAVDEQFEEDFARLRRHAGHRHRNRAAALLELIERAVGRHESLRSARHPAAQSNGFVAVGVRISEDQREIALDTPHQRARRRECSVGEVAGTLRDMDRIGVSGEIDIDRTRALAAPVVGHADRNEVQFAVADAAVGRDGDPVVVAVVVDAPRAVALEALLDRLFVTVESKVIVLAGEKGIVVGRTRRKERSRSGASPILWNRFMDVRF